MKVFAHGSNVNFQESAREMVPADLADVLKRYLKESKALLLGTIDLTQAELRQYGYVQSIQMDEEQFHCRFLPFESQEEKEITYAMDELLISHEAHFDVVDPKSGKLRYQVAYVTFESDDADQNNEMTYFFADAERVENPLMYIATFWEQVHEVGRDTDFAMTGCRAHDVSKKWNR